MYSRINLNNSISFLKQTKKVFDYLDYLKSKDINKMNFENIIRIMTAHN